MTIIEYSIIYVIAGFVVTFFAICRQLLRGKAELIEDMSILDFVFGSLFWPVTLSFLVYKGTDFLFEIAKQKLIDSV